MRITKFLSVLLLVAAIVPAALGQVLQINGHFRGTPSGYNPVPGWTLSSGGGGARVLPSFRRGEFVLELTASRQYPQAAVSDLQPITANTVTITAALRGNGKASIGYETFDANQTRLAGANATYDTHRMREQLVRKDYLITDPNAKYVRIVLTAQVGTTAQFREVTAALTNSAPPPPPPVVAPPPPPAAAPVPPPPPAPRFRHLKLRHSYVWAGLADEETLLVTIPRGSEVSFSLQEFPRRRLFWSTAAADSRYCHVHVHHEQVGRIPHRVENARIRLKAVWPGQSDVVLVCGPKKVVIRVTCP